MINTEFDPYQALLTLAENQERLAENQKRIAQAITESTNNYNQINRRLCIAENTINELTLMVAELKIQNLKEVDK